MNLLRLLLVFLITLFCTALVYDTVFPPVSTLMVAQRLSGESVTRRFVPLNRMSPHLVRAVIAAEDGKFCQHAGIDWKAMHGAVAAAIDPDAQGGHGASTITMQTVKNLFLWNGRSYARKALEAPLALGLDLVWSKRRIMESYLNIAEFGRGIYGAEAAARHYFGVSAAGLSAHQASLLAATLPNPVRRNPRAPSGFMQTYAGNISARVGMGANTSCLK